MSPESRMRTDRTDRRRVCEGEGRESEGTEGGRSDPANNRPGVHSRQLRSVGDDHGAGRAEVRRVGERVRILPAHTIPTTGTRLTEC